MDIYISKKCPHCKKILMMFYNNKHLIQYFNIIDIEGISVPSYIQSVPTLTYNGELYYDDRLYGLIESVNQHEGENNLMQQYCFLDDGYKEQSQKQNNSSDKQGKFDNNAYEAMMKSRGAM